MYNEFKSSIKYQFTAAIDTLENAISACPDVLWGNETESDFWYRAYHTIFWLDFYLTASIEFKPPAPFTMSETDPKGVLPDRVYTKEELLLYLNYCREKFLTQIESFTEEDFMRRFKSNWMDYSIAELMLYNMRHVQHHAAQLNLILRNETGIGQRWVSGAKGRSQ